MFSVLLFLEGVGELPSLKKSPKNFFFIFFFPLKIFFTTARKYN